ncbi:family A G protein-coupled receptor-like protein [Mytilinidion resinicola]|uniref:Family A G protein-coupled receptor-like protein n=1 Tax=Mytilinidion resinicola TaxID=574789 RepID=A0A6A6YHE6_9PEZI|nr:family A G protein-coupled receptor-like protein [Mytilinidion resinicola]KAF2807435.1 family A G protein-coupled receptor-like protein [Mytilinidion resinicola]
MSALDRRAGNGAISTNGNTVNGGTADIAITTHGSDLYFAICAAMGTATIVFMSLALTKPRQHRIFHYITSGVTMVATIAYFSMGSNLGWTPIEVEYHRSESVVRGNYREIFYVRYIDWFITTPLLLMDLLLTAGMPWPSVLWVILVDEVMIVTGLVGALVRSDYKWGYFAMGCAALVYIVYVLGWEARKHASALGPDIGRVFLMCGSLTTVLWIMYPIAWGVCEGGNVIPPDSEAIFYSVLDFLAKPIFGTLLLFGHRNIDPSRLGLRIRDYDEDPMVHGGIQREKRGATQGAAGNGVTAVGATTGENV